MSPARSARAASAATPASSPHGPFASSSCSPSSSPQRALLEAPGLVWGRPRTIPATKYLLCFIGGPAGLGGMYPLRVLDGAGAPTVQMGGALPGAGASLGTPLGSSLGAPLQGASAEERLDASSDSAVSSMGSERVASLSDGGEWMETGSDSEPYHLDCKYRAHPHSHAPHEYTSGYRGAQKKHHMFGKQRYFQGEQPAGGLPVGPPPPSMATPMPLKLDFGESSRPVPGALPQGAAQHAAPAPVATNGSVASGLTVPGSGASAFTSPLAMEDEELRAHELKFGYYGQEYPRQHHARPPMEPVAHNHTYHLPPPPESSGAIQRPPQRDKHRSKDSRKSDDAHLSRDEKRARALNVPMTVDDIINLPMDEFNERLSKHDLSEPQLSLIRDIRRRGKNKVAAQNCRKRKLDQIVTLADEVQQMRSRKQKLLREHDYLTRETAHSKDKFSQLYRHVFSSLRDADGNPYSPYEYSLQQGPDGSVMVVPLTSSPSGAASASTMDAVHQQMSRSLAMAESAASLHYSRGAMPQHQADRQKDQQHQQQQHPHGQHSHHPHLPHQPHPHPHPHPHHPNPHPHPHPPHHPHTPHHPHSDPHRKE